MVGEQTIYESADGRDSRYVDLVHEVAVADADWTARFLAWLRTGAHLLSASLVGGLEAARALIAAGIPGGRQIVASALQRADEPGEALAYWTGAYGRKIPKAVKRGIADAALRLYNERAVLKWDTASKGFRFGDVAAALFGLALARRCAAADLVSFSSAHYYYNDPPGPKTKQFELTRGGSLLADLGKWKDGGWFLGGGTDTAGAVAKHYAGHDRVVILTDEQAKDHGRLDVTAAVPKDRMVYTWNLAGYAKGHAPSGTGTRHTFGGLNDSAFAMIALLECGRDADWPF